MVAAEEADADGALSQKHVASSCLDTFYACAGHVTEASKASSEVLQPVISVIIRTLSSWLLPGQGAVLLLTWCFHAGERRRHSLVRRPGPGQGNHGIASTFGSLRGISRVEADVFLRSLGAEVRTTAGGYTHYTFSDSSEVWLRPNGEVVRLPQREYNSQGQRTNKGMRLDENGVLTALHTTGERVED